VVSYSMWSPAHNTQVRHEEGLGGYAAAGVGASGYSGVNEAREMCRNLQEIVQCQFFHDMVREVELRGDVFSGINYTFILSGDSF